MKLSSIRDVLKDIQNMYGDIEIRFECPFCHKYIIPINILQSKALELKDKKRSA